MHHPDELDPRRVYTRVARSHLPPEHFLLGKAYLISFALSQSLFWLTPWMKSSNLLSYSGLLWTGLFLIRTPRMNVLLLSKAGSGL